MFGRLALATARWLSDTRAPARNGWEVVPGNLEITSRWFGPFLDADLSGDNRATLFGGRLIFLFFVRCARHLPGISALLMDESFERKVAASELMT